MINSGGREFVFVLSGDASGVQAASQSATAALRGTEQGTAALDAANAKATETLGGMIGSLGKLSVAGLGLSQMAQYAAMARDKMIEAAVSADRLNLQIGAAVGQAAAVEEIEHLRQVSNRLGLELNTTATAYARVAAAARGTSMEGAGIRALFDSVARAAAVMGLDVGETQGALRALEQMMTKGVVQAEELRGQLGDRLPGAMQIAARSMGVTTGELMRMVQAGEVIATDFLPRFASQLDKELGSATEKAGETMQAAINRVSNASEVLYQQITRAGIGDVLRARMNNTADGMTAVAAAMAKAREEGAGFFGQLQAGQIAILQVINPLSDVGKSAATLAKELDAAKRELANLHDEMRRNPGNIFLAEDIKQAEKLIQRLQQAQETARGKDRQPTLAEFQAREMAEYGEARARRLDKLKAVTADLNNETSKLNTTVKVLNESLKAGDLSQPQYAKLLSQANEKYGEKVKAAKPEPPVDHFVLDAIEGRMKIRSEAFAADTRVREFMLGKVQASDERQMQIEERRTTEAAKLVERLVENTERAQADLIPDAEARARKLLDVERMKYTAQANMLGLDAARRKLVEDEIDNYIAAREAQLTEELKPEWQKRIEAFGRTAQLMRDSYNSIMQGIVEEGEKAFSEWLRTGKLSTRSLVSFIGDEFAKLGYRKYLAGAVSSAGNWLLGALGLGAAGGAAGEIAGPGLKLGGFSIGGGAAVGTNFVERDMLTILHKGEAVIPRAFNPWGASAPPSAPPPVVLNVTYNVPVGSSPAAYAAALQANDERIKAEVAADMARPGRTLQRAAMMARA